MREDYCFRSNETRDFVNKALLNITEEQKVTLLELRSVSRSHLDDCREYLEKNGWNAALAYGGLNRDGKTQQLSI